MKRLKFIALFACALTFLNACKKEDLYEVENGNITGKITFTTKNVVPITVDPSTKQPIIATIEVVGTGTLTTIGDVNFNSKFKFDYSKLTGTEFVTTYTDKSGNTIELGGTAQGAPTATPTVLAIKVTEPITRGTGRFARITGKGTSDILLNAVTLGGEFTVNWVVTF
ncbi:hypothetical protein FHS57_005705 [Runella defluvii]|uniref:Lipocalin-like domain-containing protein n=1 Tax=Runella defluvii TaxID=370973 RepID=A0A7W5ZT85_9BACT|nr:hypothetical protein [Runella defluvii]MBB3841676.1 hypothetical protein [Runella defluvii]